MLNCHSKNRQNKDLIDKWELNEGQKYCRMLQVEHSAIPLTCIKQYSQISVIRTPIIRNYWVIRRRWTVPNFFSIIYCNKTTNYSNFDYPKNSIFRSNSSVPNEESAIKLPFKIRSPKVTHGDHDFFVWSSSIYTPE